MVADSKTDRTDVSAVPLYQQVMDDLKGEIARGVYPVSYTHLTLPTILRV